jgi:hypothetical protein
MQITSGFIWSLMPFKMSRYWNARWRIGMERRTFLEKDHRAEYLQAATLLSLAAPSIPLGFRRLT